MSLFEVKAPIIVLDPFVEGPLTIHIPLTFHIHLIMNLIRAWRGVSLGTPTDKSLSLAPLDLFKPPVYASLPVILSSLARSARQSSVHSLAFLLPVLYWRAVYDGQRGVTQS